MKKIFISILSAAMFAACAKTETEDVIPVNPEPEDEAQTVYVEIGATTGSDTKATYDENLKAYWEAGDQILAVQGHACDWKAGGNEKTIQANSIDLISGESTNSAIFAGTISTQTSESKYFHFAYPVSGTSLSTYGKIGALGTNNTQTTTCTYTVPAEQDGKWTPFLCASTAEKTTAENIRNIDFGTSRNACFAVRVFAKDGTTPKRVQRIIVTAENQIVGTISATTDNDGSFSGKEFALTGTGNSITADQIQGIDKLGNYYEYRFEVLPVDAGRLTLELIDAAGSKIIRYTNAVSFQANHRKGVNVTWDDATVSMGDDEPFSWYDDYARNGFSTKSGNTVYVNGAKIRGVAAADVKTIGVRLRKLTNDGQDTEDIVYYPNTDLSMTSDTNGTLSFNSQINNIPSGKYKVRPYAIIVNADGTEQEIISGIHTTTVTAIPTITSHTIRSSYNNNGAVDKDNNFDGDKIYAAVSTSDAYAAENLVASATLHYGGDKTLAIDAKGTEFTTESLAYQAYANCYAEIVFTNGYTLTTSAYTTNVTGIPHIRTERAAQYKNHGWTTTGTITETNLGGIYNNASLTSPEFYLPESQTITVAVNISPSYSIRGTTGTITVSCSSTAAINFSKDTNKGYQTDIEAQEGRRQISLSFSGMSSTQYVRMNESKILYK